MSTREKVYEDPLMAFMGADSTTTSTKSVSSPASASTTTTTTTTTSAAPIQEDFRTINTEKVTLKTKVPKATSAPPPALEAAMDPTTVSIDQSKSSAKGLGFGVAMWDNKIAAPEVDVLATAHSDDISSGIFSKATAAARPTESAVPDFSRTKAAGRFKVTAEENDDHFSDLRVGNLVEREDTTADFELFGKTSVVQGAKGAVVTKQVFSKARKDDFELESSDTIASLESATVERKAKPTTTASSSLSFLDADPTPSLDVDLSTLDLNAYISQNSSSQGGLFD